MLIFCPRECKDFLTKPDNIYPMDYDFELKRVGKEIRKARAKKPAAQTGAPIAVSRKRFKNSMNTLSDNAKNQSTSLRKEIIYCKITRCV